MATTGRKKKWWQLWKAKPNHIEEDVEEKLKLTQAACEIEILEEVARKVDSLEAQLVIEEQRVDSRVKAAEVDTQKLFDEEMKLRSNLASNGKKLNELQSERTLLADQLEKVTLKLTEEKKAHDEQQYDKTLSLQTELESLRQELEGKLVMEVQRAREELESKLEAARSKILILQDVIQKEQSDFTAAVQGQQHELSQLKNAFQSRDSILKTQREEIDDLKGKNIELRRVSIILLEDQKKLEELRKKKPVSVRREDEIRVRPRTKIPGFGGLGRELDEWLCRTGTNVKVCIKSFGPDGKRHLKEHVPILVDGATCQVCGCSAGPHERSTCRVCQMLDLSDGALLP